MSATIVRDFIYEAFRSDAGHDRTFYDGHTFCGNPITAAAALETLRIYEDEQVLEQARRSATVLAEGFTTLATLDACSFRERWG